MSDNVRKIYGIDLGTTYTSIAYMDEYGKPVVVHNAENMAVTPSVVFFDGDNIVVGEVAKESSRLYPHDVVSFIKRSMGEPDYVFEHNGRTFRPEEISSFVIRKVVQDAEHSSGEKITDVVITCPAYFGINEREATRRAGEIAGYNVRQIINEPTAAAIAYGTMEVGADEERVVVVYDLGGGTFDITMIEIQANSIEVICTGGDHNLGGKDWDDRIVAYLVQEFQNATKSAEDILDDADTCQDLQLSAEKAKKVLSQRDKTPVLITHGGERVKVVIERRKFEEITQDFLERTVALTHEMLEEAKKKGYWNFDEIILVGGATRMPQVTARIQREFNMKPRVFDPDEAVAKGAAIYGMKIALNEGLKQQVVDKRSKEMSGQETLEFEIDDVLEEVEQLVKDDDSMTPSQMKLSRVRVKNVTSKSFGIIAVNSRDEEIVFNLILKNTDVPKKITKTFGTAVANQEAVTIQIMENESNEVMTAISEAAEIGTAVLDLPENLPADTPIDITFKLNEEGRLEITAIEPTASKRTVNVSIDTRSVIQGEEFEQAKARSRSLVVS